jgi:hypothetical protein
MYQLSIQDNDDSNWIIDDEDEFNEVNILYSLLINKIEMTVFFIVESLYIYFATGRATSS